jgi:hypothetical protein
MLDSIINRCKEIVDNEVTAHLYKSLEEEEADELEAHMQHQASMEKNAQNKKYSLRQELGSDEYDRIYPYLVKERSKDRPMEEAAKAEENMFNQLQKMVSGDAKLRKYKMSLCFQLDSIVF